MLTIAAQTLNPIATNAATTLASCAALDSHLRSHQTATSCAACATRQPPTQPPAQPLCSPCATRQPQPPTQPPMQPTYAATRQPPDSCAALRNQRATNPASARAVQPQSRAAQPPAQPCAASYSPVQPLSVISNLDWYYAAPTNPVMADSLKEVVPAHVVPVPSPVPLYLGGKRKTRWILGKEPKPAESDPKFDEWVSDNCIILGWMFNSMEDRVYHMFMYHDTVHGLWTALTQMYAHARNESRIFELYREILNTSPLPSLYEAFAIVDGDERRRRILPSLSLPESSSIVPDQRAFAAASGTHLYCQHCRKPGHLIDRCWVLHPELKQQFSRPRGGGRGGGRSGGELQIAQLQSHLGLATASQSSGPTAAIVAETPTALHGKSGHPTWILDSGANNHMTGELATFTSPVTSIHQSVCIADGSSIPIRSQGDACLSSDITLSSVYYVPNFAYNLLSVSRLAKDLNCAVVFLPSRCLLQDLTSKKIFGRGYERDGLYYFGDPLPSSASSSSLHVFSPPMLESSILSPSGLKSSVFSFQTLDLWHARLGHANFQYLCWLFPSFNKACQKFNFQCDVCELSKHTRASYIPRMLRAPSAFDLIHSDVWGPSPVTALSQHRYYVTFIDDYTRCTWVYLMRHKSEVFSHFTHFLQMIKTQYNTVVRNIRSDNGREYITNEFRAELNKCGILQQLTCPYTPEQNGVAERKNRHIMSVVRCLLRGMGVPKYFWHMAVLTATYLINRTPSRVLNGKAPLHILQPASTLFPIIPRVFGCTCFVQNRSPTRTKLDDKAVRCIFLGYSSMSKGYRCYDPVTRHMYHSLDVTFLETVPFFSNSTPNPGSEILAADEPIPPRPLPILEPTSPTPTPNGSLSPIASQDPGPRAQAPLPASSPESGMSSPFVSDIPPPRSC
ncbi:hypothetical protein Acr_04g0005890 [Actinidia rufa]|uniref:Integrase catalytic domain-containing protein n=1 Tax=Actinidia rufa TaxID=165716 RepID=A0A7J0EHB0_9ERIC|nr:hypothetical protein Acr_04g0005890 [Actinidia rufa]